MTLPQQVPVSTSATIVCGLPLPRLSSPVASVDALEARTRALTTWADISGASSYDATDTALTTAAARGATSISVTADAALAGGRTYLVSPTARPAADYRFIRAAEVDSAGEVVRLVAPLGEALASGATVVGWSVLAELSAVQVGDYPGPIDVRGTVTLDSGEVLRFWQVARAVYRAVVPPIDTSTVEAIAPMAPHLARGADLDMDQAIAAAWELLLGRLEARGVDPWGIKDPERLTEAHATAIVRLFVDADPKHDEDFRAEVQRQHREALDALAGNPHLWLDRDEDSDGDRDEPMPDTSMGSMWLTRRGS